VCVCVCVCVCVSVSSELPELVDCSVLGWAVDAVALFPSCRVYCKPHKRTNNLFSFTALYKRTDDTGFIELATVCFTATLLRSKLIRDTRQPQVCVSCIHVLCFYRTDKKQISRLHVSIVISCYSEYEYRLVWMTMMLRIWKVSLSNLSPQTVCPEVLRALSQFLQTCLPIDAT
jgi:hypothetical protein